MRLDPEKSQSGNRKVLKSPSYILSLHLLLIEGGCEQSSNKMSVRLLPKEWNQVLEMYQWIAYVAPSHLIPFSILHLVGSIINCYPALIGVKDIVFLDREDRGRIFKANPLGYQEFTESEQPMLLVCFPVLQCRPGMLEHRDLTNVASFQNLTDSR